jgi:hypothetical protein
LRRASAATFAVLAGITGLRVNFERAGRLALSLDAAVSGVPGLLVSTFPSRLQPHPHSFLGVSLTVFVLFAAGFKRVSVRVRSWLVIPDFPRLDIALRRASEASLALPPCLGATGADGRLVIGLDDELAVAA